MPRSRTHTRPRLLTTGFQLVTLLGCLAVPLAEAEHPAPDRSRDARHGVRVTRDERGAVLYVMRENLRSVHQILEATHRGAFDEARMHAQASMQARSRLRAADAFPLDTPRLWAELGRAADEQLESVGFGGDSDRERIWTELGGTTRVCNDCHRRYRLDLR